MEAIDIFKVDENKEVRIVIAWTDLPQEIPQPEPDDPPYITGIPLVNDLDLSFFYYLADLRSEVHVNGKLPIEANVVCSRVLKVALEGSSMRGDQSNLESESLRVSAHIECLRLGASAVYRIE